MEIFAIVLGVSILASMVTAFVIVNRLISHKEAQVRREHGLADEKE